ncbi:sulfatase-like hydrolase/transferase [Altericroceibacterium endophyticum]|uniref:Sulfatase-like hydrolase/transferase n=1 Tax=Altericroceibacterium endophyticum TaxID=1808508 RepID=A0A6I4T6W3_9SPHN|nr:sulfatase-like hydrolase/transferase [Altericroceibacterium endophyticum]MXO66219.1 sulfatase-like hydrolase/transferase [Altericroceibacterium endophyticum]
MFKKSQSKSRILSTASAAALTLFSATSATAQTEAEARPNVLLIVLDDVGLDMTTDILPGEIDRMLTKYGPEGRGHPDAARIDGRPASMPVLNSLARKSLVFANAWAEPFCSPTRAAMLTGLYPERTRVLDYTDWLTQSHLSLGTMMQDQGYSTALIGKWHLSGLNDIRPDAPPHKGPLYPGMKPKEAGFDLFRGDLNGALPDYWEYKVTVQDADTPPSEWRVETQPARSLPGIAPTTFAPVVKAADTVDWVTQQESTAPDKPWFAWLAFNMPHILPGQPPVVVPNRGTLDPSAIAEIEACGGEFGSKNLGDCSAPSLNRAMSTATDTVMGLLLEAVEELDPNTVVIVIGDNGTGQYGRPEVNFLDNLYITYEGRGKGTGYESGVRVPLIVHGPGMVEGRNDAIVHAVDLFSTIAELGGVTLPENVPNRTGDAMVDLDSVSLLPILSGQTDTVRAPDIGYVTAEGSSPLADNRLQAAVRNAQFKILCTRSDSGEDNGCEFYDLKADPLEEYPLAITTSCASDGTEAPVTDEARQYCYLKHVVDTDTILASSDS